MHQIAPGEYTTCPIALEEFDKVDVDEFLPPSQKVQNKDKNCNSDSTQCFVQGKPEYCVGWLPCGHHFHPVAVLCHMMVNGMRCPVCR